MATARLLPGDGDVGKVSDTLAPPPFQGGGVKVATVRLLPGGNDVGDLFPYFRAPTL